MLTYEEWIKVEGGELMDDPFDSAESKRTWFFELHGKDLDQAIDEINKEGYQLYLQRCRAEEELKNENK